ncbi:MAG: MFS transporter [Robiginitomaculum sp.]|nr:MFS transporter [Robiginitomaculum sp.]
MDNTVHIKTGSKGGQSAQKGWKMSIAAAISCICIVGMSFGLGLPLLAMNLEVMTGSGLVIGINAFAGAISTVIAAPFAPLILSKLPARPVLIFSLLLTAASFILYKLIPSVPFWLLIRFVSGFAITVLFVASESWINQLTPDHLRSRMLSIYSISLAAGFGLGGFLVSILGISGWAPFLAGAIICAAGVLPLLAPGPQLIAPSAKESSPFILLSYFGKAPRIMMAAMAFGAIETAAMHFSPIWAARSGLEETQALRLIMVGAIGVIALQFPIGWLGDKIDRYQLLKACAVGTLIAPIAMWLVIGQSVTALYVVFFIYVGIGEGLYILALVLVGQKFSHKEMTAASAAIVLMYGIGSILSPLIIGPLMDIFNPNGAMFGLAGFALAYLAFTLVYRGNKSS